jgi:hypothetical protein
MLIVIEGPDGCGKSTLAQKISENFDFKYYKEVLTYAERLDSNYNGYEHYFKLVEYMILSRENYVCDRLHLGEFVNPLIYKDGRDPLTLEQIEQIEFGIKSNSILISAIASEDFINDTLNNRGDDIAKKDNIKYMIFLYSFIFNLSTIENKINWDVSLDKNYIKIFTEIDKKIKILNRID